MPSTTVSSGLSWGAYLATAFGLLEILLPPMTQIGTASQREAAVSCVEGTIRVIDSLQPGISIRLPYECGGSSPLLMSGHSVAISVSNGSVSGSTRWRLANATLQPGRIYIFSLSPGQVSVISDG